MVRCGCGGGKSTHYEVDTRQRMTATGTARQVSRLLVQGTSIPSSGPDRTTALETAGHTPTPPKADTLTFFSKPKPMATHETALVAAMPLVQDTSISYSGNVVKPARGMPKRARRLQRADTSPF